MPGTEPRRAGSNLLCGEASPYLLQHASNPVWWHAWDDAALKRAADEDKPIFLSVGYSSCHWCHVMAHESFEDEGIAALLNEHFVSIKVDREERPDVDDVYQKACQMATGQGGWPLSAFLTPDQKPFYIGTYFPPSDVAGRRGFGGVLRWLAQAWAEHRADVAANAERFAESLRAAESAGPAAAGGAPPRPAAPFDRAAADEAAVNLLHMADEHNGGFGSAPKFPSSACVSFLLRYGRMSGLAKFTRIALRTLDRMAAGGIFDHVGGGFHRYSTDSRWLVPHFEKMLYDNALIPVNYAEAYRATGDAAYLDVMDRTLSYVLRELAAPGGGFYSAQDADAGGEEGLYYTWTRSEALDALRSGDGALSGAEADAFCAYYDVTDGGNWEGRAILYNSAPLHAVAFRFGLGDDAARAALRAGREKLLARRAEREAPGLDDNVIASWNALAASALAAGDRVAPGRGYLAAAERCVERVAFGMRSAGGGVSRVARPGRGAIPGGLDDHANCANALLDVFEASPEERYLERAAELGRVACERFWDDESGGFFMTADAPAGGGGGEGEPAQRRLVVRPRSRHDMSVPSGGSAAVRALMRLHALTGEAEPGRVAARALEAQARGAAENPFAFGNLLNAAMSLVDDPPEVTVVNAPASDIARRVLSMYLPGSPVVTVASAGQLAALSGRPYFAGKRFGGRTEVYVCRAGACSAPLHSMGQVEEALAARPPPGGAPAAAASAAAPRSS